jgi:glutamine synthetase
MNWNYDESLRTADRHVFFKFMVKTIAEKYSLRATFMPKPFENLTGNGCHAHISLWSGNKNLFLDKGDKLGLTRQAYNFLGGILYSAEALSAFFNPSINSYRRIDAPTTASGATWSPSKISYTGNNRTHMIRVPDPGRFELRLMDGSANPYLLQAGIIAAGIDGMEKRRDPGHPLLINMYTDGDNYPNIKKLPSNLESAIEYLSSNEVLLRAFGERIITSYIKLKEIELKDFSSKETFSKKEPITGWEKINTLDC